VKGRAVRGRMSVAGTCRVDEEGSVVEAVVVVPAAMIVVLLAVQICLWAHAASAVQAAAVQGDTVACLAGSTATAGEAAARRELGVVGAVVDGASVASANLPGDEIEMTVRGTATPILPWLHLPVSAVEVGTRQEFRVAG